MNSYLDISVSFPLPRTGTYFLLCLQAPFLVHSLLVFMSSVCGRQRGCVAGKDLNVCELKCTLGGNRTAACGGSLV